MMLPRLGEDNFQVLQSGLEIFFFLSVSFHSETGFTSFPFIVANISLLFQLATKITGETS